jgi:hypothetical protein
VKNKAEVTMNAPSPTELANCANARSRGAPAGGRKLSRPARMRSVVLIGVSLGSV